MSSFSNFSSTRVTFPYRRIDFIWKGYLKIFVVRRVQLVAEARVPQLVGLLQDGHRQRREPHRADQEQLGKVEPVDAPVSLPESVEDAEPEEEQGEQEGRLEDGVDGRRKERHGQDGPGEQRVVEHNREGSKMAT